MVLMIVSVLAIWFLLCLTYIIIGLGKGHTLTQLVIALSGWLIAGVVFALLAIIVCLAKMYSLAIPPDYVPLFRPS